MGRIGAEIAKRALALEMKVIYHNRRALAADHPLVTQTQWVDFPQLLQTSDVLLVLIPYTPENHYLIDARALAQLKSTARLIVLSRGGIVDEEALMNALLTQKLAGAALDVFENEPHINPRWQSVPQALLVPHIGSATLECRRKMGFCAINNLALALAGQAPPNRVP